MGMWIVCFAINIGIYMPVCAELWAVTNGLKLVWSKVFQQIILELDSTLLVDLIIKDKINIDKNYNLIMQARDLSSKDWEVQAFQ